MKKWIVAIFALSIIAVSAQAGTARIALPCEFRDPQISPTGEQVLALCKDETLHLFNLPSGKEERAIPGGKKVRSYQFSPDGKNFAVGFKDGSVQVYASAVQAAPVQFKIAEAVDDINFLPGNKALVISAHMSAGQVWDISGTPRQVATLATDFDGLTTVAVSPDGKWVATCGADTVVRLWDTANWKLKSEYRKYLLEPFAAAFTQDGKWLLVGGADQQITILDAGTLAEVRKLPAQADPLGLIAALDANHVAVLYFDADGRKPLHFDRWDLQAGKRQPITAESEIKGCAAVKGKFWLAGVDGKELQLWSAD